MTNDLSQTLNRYDDIEIRRELLDETEKLLQFGSLTWEVGTDAAVWTPGLLSMFEYGPGEVRASDGLSFYLGHIMGSYRPAFEALLATAVRDKAGFSFEYVVRTRSGLRKDISTTARPQVDQSGAVARVICTHRDVTEWRTFEKEKERSLRELNRSNRDLEEFAYIASHDLQEPLRKISMFTERLRAKYDNALDSEGELFVERILASAANMRNLIDNLLDFSRVNRRSNPFTQVDLVSVINRVVADFEPTIAESGANVSIVGSIPAVEAVEQDMRQLFSNLLSNAIKFRRSGTPTEIAFRVDRVDDEALQPLGFSPGVTCVKIEVEDNGIGFDPEYSEKIFQIFQRLNGKSEYPGSGIGLAISKKIVEKHNGIIFAHGEPDKGAIFTVVLPELKS